MSFHAITVEPFPDETLTSVIARLYYLHGYHAWRQLYNEATGSNDASLTSGTPSHLNFIARFLDLGLSGKDLLHQFTLWNGVSAFMEPKPRQRLFAHLLGDSGDETEQASQVQVKPRLPRHLFLCPTCLREDNVRYGVAYWHRSHQMPMVSCCWKHHRSTQELAISHARRAIPLPNDCFHASGRRDSPASDMAVRYAQVAHDVLACIHPPSDTLICGVYRQRCAGIGLEKGSRLRYAEIASQCESVQTDLGACGDLGRPSSWLANVLYGHSSNPVMHLILICAIFEQWTAFENAWRNYKAPPAAAPTASKRDLPKPAELEVALAQPGATVRQVARSIGWSDTTMRVRCRRLGIKVSERTGRISPLAWRSVATDLCRGVLPKHIAQRRRVSLSSVQRFKHSSPAIEGRYMSAIRKRQESLHREELEELLAASGSSRRTDVRRLNGKLYLWLVRNDRAWFSRRLPAQGHDRLR